MANSGIWGKHNEQVILDARDAIVRSAFVYGFNTVIIDDTNLHPKHLERMKQIAKELKREIIVEEKFFEISPEEAIKRDLKRPNSVGAEVIWRMYHQFISPKPEFLPQAPQVVEYNYKLPDCIICDLDGTLAWFKFPDGVQTRSPFDASQCDKTDKIHTEVKRIVDMYHSQGVSIILFSGRSAAYHKPTERFLKANEVPYKGLFMRAEKDQRNDRLVKREMWEKYVKDKFNVRLVLDDRDQVVDMWRNELGFNTFQVANGNF